MKYLHCSSKELIPVIINKWIYIRFPLEVSSFTETDPKQYYFCLIRCTITHVLEMLNNKII